MSAPAVLFAALIASRSEIAPSVPGLPIKFAIEDVSPSRMSSVVLTETADNICRDSRGSIAAMRCAHSTGLRRRLFLGWARSFLKKAVTSDRWSVVSGQWPAAAEGLLPAAGAGLAALTAEQVAESTSFVGHVGSLSSGGQVSDCGSSVVSGVGIAQTLAGPVEIRPAEKYPPSGYLRVSLPSARVVSLPSAGRVRAGRTAREGRAHGS